MYAWTFKQVALDQQNIHRFRCLQHFISDDLATTLILTYQQLLHCHHQPQKSCYSFYETAKCLYSHPGQQQSCLQLSSTVLWGQFQCYHARTCCHPIWQILLSLVDADYSSSCQHLVFDSAHQNRFPERLGPRPASDASYIFLRSPPSGQANCQTRVQKLYVTFSFELHRG